MALKEAKTAWRSGSGKTDKPWGHEVKWSSFGGVTGKTLFLNKGCRTSLKYHPLKNEVLFFREGRAKVMFGDERTVKNPDLHPYKIGIFKPGDVLNVQSGCPYRIEALEDCEIIEIGDKDTLSSVRIDDDYDRHLSSDEKEKQSDASDEEKD